MVIISFIMAFPCPVLAVIKGAEIELVDRYLAVVFDNTDLFFPPLF